MEKEKLDGKKNRKEEKKKMKREEDEEREKGKAVENGRGAEKAK